MIAGPNGSGKTTLTRWLRQTDIDLGQYINPDDIALELEGSYEARTAEAQQVADRRREEYIRTKQSFSFETVMSHPSKLEVLVRARQAGFFYSGVLRRHRGSANKHRASCASSSPRRPRRASRKNKAALGTQHESSRGGHPAGRPGICVRQQRFRPQRNSPSTCAALETRQGKKREMVGRNSADTGLGH
jgi:hypothetical protein